MRRTTPPSHSLVEQAVRGGSEESSRMFWTAGIRLAKISRETSLRFLCEGSRVSSRAAPEELWWTEANPRWLAFPDKSVRTLQSISDD